MDITAGLLIGLTIVGIVAAGLVGFAAVRVAAAATSTQRFLDETRPRSIDVLNRASTALDDVHAELARVDQIVSRVEGVSDMIGSTTDAAHGLASKMSRLPAGVATFLAALTRSRR